MTLRFEARLRVGASFLVARDDLIADAVHTNQMGSPVPEKYADLVRV
jgi:hypothetical protein